MATAESVAKAQPSEIDPFALRRFSVTEYHKMIKAGILKPDDRVELLEGWIVKKMPQNPPHSSSVTRANRWLARVVPAHWTLRVPMPIALSDSEPEPDIVLARGDAEHYDRRYSKPTDIGLLMEFADSTLLQDRSNKKILYAQARIAAFWLINLVERKLEVYTKPHAGTYRNIGEHVAKERIALVLDGVKIAEAFVHELMPKP